MDDRRFDALTRTFASRRAALGGLLAALAPVAGVAKPNGRGATNGGGTGAQRCVANGQRCGKGSGKRGKPDRPCKACCSKYGTPKAQGPQRCSCKPNTSACTNDAQCCGGQCTGGQCGPCDPGLTLCQPGGCVKMQTNQDHCGACGQACAANQVCQGGSCTCTRASCPDGCCEGSQCRTGTADGACGQDGAICQACEFSCVDRTCTDCSGMDVCPRGCPFSSVQAAINAAAPGATITICAGSYRENLVIDTNVTLVGAGQGSEADTNTILHGDGTDSVVDIRPDRVVTLRDLRITGGKSFAGAGISNLGHLTAEQITVTGNDGETYGQGAGIYNHIGSMTMTACTVTKNTRAIQGGGIYNVVGLTLTDCTLTDNSADQGGGLFNQGEVTLYGGSVSDNTAEQGGGIFNIDTVTLYGGSVTGNDASDSGGGIFNILGTVTLTDGASVTGNFPGNCRNISGSINGTCTG